MTRRLRIFFLKLSKLLIITATVLLAVSLFAYFFIADTLGLDAQINQEIKTELGVECSIDKVHVLIFPKPGIQLENVLITAPKNWFGDDETPEDFSNLHSVVDGNGTAAESIHNATFFETQNSTNATVENIAEQPDNNLSIASLNIYLDIPELLNGNLVSSGLAIHGLVLKARSIDEIQTIANHLTGKPNSETKILQNAIEGPQIIVQESQIIVEENSISMMIAETADMLTDVRISDSSVLLLNANGQYTPLLEKIELNEFLNEFNGGVVVHDQIDGEPYSMYIEFKLSQLQTSNDQASCKLQIELNDKRGFKPKLVTEINYSENENKILFNNLILTADKNTLNANLCLTLPRVTPAPLPASDTNTTEDTEENTLNNKSSWQLTGPLEVTSLGLPYWIESLRSLSPETQYLLSNINAQIDLLFNESGIYFNNIKAVTETYDWQGSGYVKNFSDPTVGFDFATKEISLEVVFPELISPDLPLRFNEPDILWQNQPFFLSGDEGESPDIKISFKADKTGFRNLEIESLEAVLTNSPLAMHWTVTAGKLSGGNLEAKIDVNDDDTLEAQGSLTSVNIKNTLDGLGIPLNINGDTDAQFTLSGQTLTAKQFLETMILKTNGKAQSVIFGEKTNAKPNKQALNYFQNLSFDATLEGDQKNSEKTDTALGIKAKFDGTQDKDTFKLSAHGPIQLDAENNISANNLALTGTISSTFGPIGFTSKQPAAFKGTFTYSEITDQFTLNLPSISLGAMIGNATITAKPAFKEPVFSGKIDFKTNNLRELLTKTGTDVSRVPPHLLTQATLNTNFVVTSHDDAANELNIPAFKAIFDNTTLDGAITRNSKGNIKIVAHADIIDLDEYWPENVDNTDALPAKPWNVKNILNNNLQLAFNLDKLTFMKLPVETVVITAKIENEILQAELSASTCSGQALADLYGKETSGKLESTLGFHLMAIDMEKLTMARSNEIKAGGLLEFGTSLKGQLASFDDMPKAMSGDWNFNIGKGYFNRSVTAGPARAASNGHTEEHSNTQIRTNIDYIKGSGPVENGIFKSENIVLDGPSTSMKANGYADLDKKKIDMFLDLRMAGVSLPVELKGNLTDPEISLKGGKFITKNITNIGGGLLDIVGSIVTLPIRVLEIPGNRTTESNE